MKTPALPRGSAGGDVAGRSTVWRTQRTCVAPHRGATPGSSAIWSPWRKPSRTVMAQLRAAWRRVDGHCRLRPAWL